MKCFSFLALLPRIRTNCLSSTQITQRFSVFGCSPRLKLIQLWRIFLDVVVPALLPEPRFMDVSGCIPAGLDAGNPCRHDDARASSVKFVGCCASALPRTGCLLARDRKVRKGLFASKSAYSTYR